MVPQAEQYSVSPGKSKPEMRVAPVPATVSAVQTGRVPPVPADQIKAPRGAAERTAAEQEFVAHKVSATADVAFIQGMFDAAFEMRGRPEGLIFHSDQGLQYTSFVFRRHLRELKVKQSFSNPGTPLDNAVAESFFACMKREELSHNYYDTIEELQRDVDEYVEFFNNMRPHQRLGMQTPSEVERNFAVKK